MFFHGIKNLVSTRNRANNQPTNQPTNNQDDTSIPLKNLFAGDIITRYLNNLTYIAQSAHLVTSLLEAIQRCYPYLCKISMFVFITLWICCLVGDRVGSFKKGELIKFIPLNVCCYWNKHVHTRYILTTRSSRQLGNFMGPFWLYTQTKKHQLEAVNRRCNNQSSRSNMLN